MNRFTEFLATAAVEASAPCRIDMGGTLDLSTFYLPLHHLGPCTFNAALNLRTRVRLEPYEGGKIKISSRGFDGVEVDSRQAPFDPPLGLMLAVAAFFDADGVHIRIDSASPVRSALGGSSSAAVALVWAFSKVLAGAGVRSMPTPADAALLAHAIEQSVAGVPCGCQDQLAAAFGGVNAWHWSGDPQEPLFRRQAIPPVSEGSDFSECLLVAYCGAPHTSTDINGAWVRDFVAGRYRPEWRGIIQLSQEFVSALVAGEMDRAQAAMNAETDVRCYMTPEVLDETGKALIRAACDGDCGARFTGAGGGGCIWALGDPSHIARLRPVWHRILAQRDQAHLLDAAIDHDGIL